jgi:cell division septum initiation protein DivIVA
MAGSDMHGTDTGRAVEADIARYKDQASVELSAAQASEASDQAGSRRLAGYRSGQADRSRLIKQARETEFPIALRGYERTAVDRYVTQVNRLIAELEMTSSPESAVRRALEEVSEETRGLLERAHQTAEEITARSRVKADDRVNQAEEEARALRKAAQHDADEIRETAQREADATREAARRDAHEVRTSAQHDSASLREMAASEVNELRDTATREVTELREAAAREAQHLRAAAQQEADRVLGDARGEAEELLDAAETRARELAQNAETIWRERRRLVDDMRAIGEQLTSIGEAEAKRFPRLSEAIPPVAVPSRATKASPRTNGGREPERANGGESESGRPGSEAKPAAVDRAEATTRADK